MSDYSFWDQSSKPDEPVFRHCNVCGRELKRKDELAVGMCAICANEEISDEDL